MAQLKLRITRNDGTSDVVSVRPVTEVAFERQYKMGMNAFSKDAHSEYLYWLAWDATKRAGTVVKPFGGPDERGPCWLNEIESVDVMRKTCASCDAINNDDSKFCDQCGAELEGEGPLATSTGSGQEADPSSSSALSPESPGSTS